MTPNQSYDFTLSIWKKTTISVLLPHYKGTFFIFCLLWHWITLDIFRYFLSCKTHRQVTLTNLYVLLGKQLRAGLHKCQLSEQCQRRVGGSFQRAAPDPFGLTSCCSLSTSCPPSSPTTWSSTPSAATAWPGLCYLSFSCSKALVSDISSSARFTLFLRLTSTPSLSLLVGLFIFSLIDEQDTSLWFPGYAGRQMHSSQSWIGLQWWSSRSSCWPRSLHTGTPRCRRTCCPAGPFPPRPCCVPCPNHFCSQGYACPSLCRVTKKSSEQKKKIHFRENKGIWGRGMPHHMIFVSSDRSSYSDDVLLQYRTVEKRERREKRKRREKREKKKREKRE